jgi:hypothetical protein
MKYNIITNVVYTDSYIDFTDSDGAEHNWSIHSTSVGNVERGETIYTDGLGNQIKMDYIIPLNIDNPQESIDKIKKLAVLK